jgi:hypothetical protein
VHVTAVTLGDTDLIQHTVRGWNLLRTEWITRALRTADPAGIGASRATQLRDALDAAGPAADPVLLDPRFGRWCAELTSLIERDAPALLPAGRFRAACREAAAFGLAARYLHLRSSAGDLRVPDTAVRVDHEGRVQLPGTGWVLVPGPGYAGLEVTVSVRGGEFILAGTELAVVPEPVPLPGLAVAGGDPVDLSVCAAEPLLTHGPPSVVVERGTDGPGAVAVPGIARVPATAGPAERARHALAAAAHLRAAAQGARLFQPGAQVTDPPPEAAHLASAPQLIRFLTLHRPPARRTGAADGTSQLLGPLAGWLAAAGCLSPLGRELLGQLTGAKHPPVGHGVPPAAAGPAGGPPSRNAQAWRAAWAKAGGTFRGPGRGPARLTASDPDLALLITELGGGDGIEVNSIVGRARADPTIDQLSLVRARDPERYAALVGRLAVPARCPAEEVLLSHRAYIEERFPAAAMGYAGLLLRLPGDIDLWRDFAFALRHLGGTVLCETVLFRLAEVVERAEECEPDLAVLGRLSPCSSPWPGAPRTVRQLAGLIEWVSA